MSMLPSKYRFHFNSSQQEVVIMRDEKVVASRSLPMQQFPNPGGEALLAMGTNQETHDAVRDLVAFANATIDVLVESPGVAEG